MKTEIENIEFKGPYSFNGEKSIFDNLQDETNGIYLWCVKIDDNTYRVYYVGEASDIKIRMRNHLSKLLSGQYSGHCIDSLKNNIRILMHRACDGMIPRFSHINRESFNQEFSEKLHLFYAIIPTLENQHDSKWLRCRLETGVITHIENQGQNVICVGHQRYWKGDPLNIRVNTGSTHIESLTNELIKI